MNNIDVSRTGFYSGFPTLVRFQDLNALFNIASYSVLVPAFTPATTTLIYDVSSSEEINKSNGIADVVIDYSGALIASTLEPYFSSVKGLTRDFFRDVLTSGKNAQVEGSLLNPGQGGWFVLTTVVWFDQGRVYTRAVLQHVNDNDSVAYTAQWAGGTITTHARISLLPY